MDEELEILKNQRALYVQMNPLAYDFLEYKNSLAHYNPIVGKKFCHLSLELCGYYNDVFDTLCFQNEHIHRLAKEGYWVIGCQLVRLQIEILTIIYADIKYNHSVILKVFKKDKELGRITIKRNRIIPSDLRKEIDTKYNTNINELYENYYCKFTHPSSYLLPGGIPEGTFFVDDTLMINQTLTKILLDYETPTNIINSKIKDNERQH